MMFTPSVMAAILKILTIILTVAALTGQSQSVVYSTNHRTRKFLVFSFSYSLVCLWFLHPKSPLFVPADHFPTLSMEMGYGNSFARRALAR